MRGVVLVAPPRFVGVRGRSFECEEDRVTLAGFAGEP